MLIYGSDLQAATITVLIKDGDTAVRFITTTFPQREQEPRPWVGLTDEDARIAAFKVPWKDRLSFDAGMFAAANILKEKNT